MSHVDEGALHAYLDGALEEYPTAEAQAIREHLEVCGSCRERLEVERVVRDDAASVLALAAPEVTVPSFEELRAYVRANTPRRSPVSVQIYRLGWAASVVLALGTGWILRGEPNLLAPSSGMRVDEVRPQESPASFDEADVVEAERAVEESPAAAGGMMQEAQAGAAPPVEAARQEAAATPVVANRATAATMPEPLTGARAGALAPTSGFADDQPVSGDVVADLDASDALADAARLNEVIVSTTDRRRVDAQMAGAPSAPAPEVVAVAPGDASQPRAAREQPAAAGSSGTAEPERRSLAADVVTSANVSSAAPATGIATLRRTIELGDTRDQSVEDDESYSLVVPNVELLDVRFRGLGVRSEGQVVLQRLESGDTLQVIHLPPDIDPSSLSDPRPGHTELVVQRAAGWIVMRAPVSEEALLELLERLLEDPTDQE